jgi:hypothetical protein
MVNSGNILYAMLLLVNEGILDNNTSSTIIDIAESAYKWYEKDYDNGHYYFRYGDNYQFDGIVMPWNQQNMFGLALIELYRATENPIYKIRLNEMMQAFQNEWIYTEDEALAWHYWPIEIYEGWTGKDKKSINSPSSEPTIDTLLEDTSHAGINCKFIIEFLNNFENDLNVKSGYKKKLTKTISKFSLKNGFSRFVSGDIEYQKVSIFYAPSPYWTDIENENLEEFYKNLGTFALPEFDSQLQLYAYANLIDKIEDTDKLKVKRLSYDLNNNLIATDKYEVLQDKIYTYSKHLATLK